jgi:hypothetical protein
MLLAARGVRRIQPSRSRVRTIWWTVGGLTAKYRWMSASAGEHPITRE